jgi:hypothetical protein
LVFYEASSRAGSVEFQKRAKKPADALIARKCLLEF